jgi:putative adhesin/SHOCT-like protein
MTMTTTGSGLEHPIGADGLFSLQLRSGDVRLSGVEGDTITVVERGGRDLGAAFEIALGDGSLSLRELRGGSAFRGGGGDLEISLPRRATVVVETSSGDLEVDGLAGDQHYRMASGDLRMRGVGGGIGVQGVSGDLNVVAATDADVTLTTVSGDVELRAATLRSLSVASTSGDAKVAGRFAGRGPFSIETVSGDVLLAPAGDLRMEMRTVSGDLSSDVGGRIESGRGQRSVSIGSGGPTLAIRSMSGDVTVVRPVAFTADPEPAVEVPTIEVTHADEDDAAGPAKPTNGALAAAYEDARLRILRSLEQGEIDVSEAGRRLEALDDGDEAEAVVPPEDAAPAADEAPGPDADADTARFDTDETSRG